MYSNYKTGKIPWDKLSRLINKLPVKDIDLVMGPSVGEDAGVVRFRDGFIVIHSDPITAASRRIGWMAIHIAANDIAVRGVKPKWFLITVLLPENVMEDTVENIFNDMARALDELGGVVVGGHTEVTPGLDRPLLIVTAMGYSVDRVIFTRDARPGDYIVIIGRIGGEGVGVIAWDHGDVLEKKGVSDTVIETAREFLWDISVVDKALSIRDIVNSMHDPTEGGILQGIREISMASHHNIEVDLDKILVDPVVEEISKAMEIDPLKLLSSGALIATVPPDRVDDLESIIRDKYTYMVCGRVLEEKSGKVLLKKNGRVVKSIEEDIIDEIYKLL